MATIAMKRVQLIGMQRQRKKLLELVQRMGAVEVTEAAEVGFSRSDSAQMRAHLDRCTRTVQQALEILNRNAESVRAETQIQVFGDQGDAVFSFRAFQEHVCDLKNAVVRDAHIHFLRHFAFARQDHEFAGRLAACRIVQGNPFRKPAFAAEFVDHSYGLS